MPTGTGPVPSVSPTVAPARPGGRRSRRRHSTPGISIAVELQPAKGVAARPPPSSSRRVTARAVPRTRHDLHHHLPPETRRSFVRSDPFATAVLHGNCGIFIFAWLCCRCRAWLPMTEADRRRSPSHEESLDFGSAGPADPNGRFSSTARRARAACGGRALRRRHADRQSRRRDVALALDAGRRGRSFRRGHPSFADPARPLRPRNAAFALSRAQRRRSASAGASSIAEGQALALISDAGTPLVSDPGFRLVAEAVAAGLAVTAAPGASAALAALCVAGRSDRSLLLRRLSAPAERGAARADQRTCRCARDAGHLRGADPACRDAWRPRRGTGPAARGGRARAHEAARGGPARNARRACGRIRRRRGAPKGEIVSSWSPPQLRAAVSSDALDRELVEALRSFVGQGRRFGRSGKAWAAAPPGLCARARTGWPR